MRCVGRSVEPAKYELVPSPWDDRMISGAHFVSESDSISWRGMEPHSRTLTLTAHADGEEVGAAVVMIVIGWK